MSIIPATYEAWEHCITVKCGIPPAAEFVAKRIQALQDMDDHLMQTFIARRGEAHHTRTPAWFRQAEERLGK